MLAKLATKQSGKHLAKQPQKPITPFGGLRSGIGLVVISSDEVIDMVQCITSSDTEIIRGLSCLIHFSFSSIFGVVLLPF